MQLSDICYHLCRLCLIKSNKACEEIFFPIDSALEDKFENVTGMKLVQEDLFPATVCISCASELEKHFNYRRGLIEKQFRLNQLYSSKSFEISSPNFIQEYELSDEITEETSEDVPVDMSEEDVLHDHSEIEGSAIPDLQSHEESDSLGYNCSESTEIIEEIGEEHLDPDYNCRDNSEEFGNEVEAVDESFQDEQFEILDTNIYVVKEETTAKVRRKYTKHNTKDAKNLDDLKYICWIDKCKYAFAFRASLKKHLLSVHRVKCSRSSCLMCGTQFHNYTDFLTHVKEHRKFECNICKMSFRSNTILQVHKERSHSGSDERYFQCSTCMAQFKRKEHLSSHVLYKHSQERAFACADCPSAFFTKMDLRHHQKTHSNVKMKCLNCDYQCRDLKSIKKHNEKIHKTLEIYECFCCKRFEKYKDLQTHKKTCPMHM